MHIATFHQNSHDCDMHVSYPGSPHEKGGGRKKESLVSADHRFQLMHRKVHVLDRQYDINFYYYTSLNNNIKQHAVQV